MDEDTKKTIGGGLLPTPRDDRDLNFGAVFGLPTLSELPAEYKTSNPLEIKNQYGSDMCAAYASASASEDQELVPLAPEFIFAQAKKLIGDWSGWGLDLRTVCKVLTKTGSIETNRLPDAFKLAPDNSNRDQIANWANWPTGIELYATKHRKRSYFSVT